MQNYRVDVKLIRSNPRQNRVCYALPLANTPREAVLKVLDYQQRERGEQVEVLGVVWGSKIKSTLAERQRPETDLEVALLRLRKFNWNPEGLDHEHLRGDLDCKGCWEPPSLCKSCGVGVMHNEWGDENYDMDYWLYTKCDNCGESR
jgi:hypothetical protein